MVSDAVVELIIGIKIDNQFGPVIVIGAGGIYTELFRDTETLLTPINKNQIKKLEAEIAQTTNKEKQLKLEEDLARVTAQAAADSQSLNEKTALELDAAVARFQNNIQTGNVGMFNDLARRERAYFVGIQSTITDSYKGTGQETMAQKQIDRLAGIDNKGGTDQGFDTGEAAQRFAVIKNHHMIAVDGAKHLWVGEPAVNRVLTEITQIIAPNRLPLPTEL